MFVAKTDNHLPIEMAAPILVVLCCFMVVVARYFSSLGPYHGNSVFCPSGPGTRFSRVQTCDRLATIIQARIGCPRHEGPTCLPHKHDRCWIRRNPIANATSPLSWWSMIYHDMIYRQCFEPLSTYHSYQEKSHTVGFTQMPYTTRPRLLDGLEHPCMNMYGDEDGLWHWLYHMNHH